MSKKNAQVGLSVFLLGLLIGSAAQAQSHDESMALNVMTTCKCFHQEPASYQGEVVAVLSMSGKKAEFEGRSAKDLSDQIMRDQWSTLVGAARTACQMKSGLELEETAVRVYCSPDLTIKAAH